MTVSANHLLNPLNCERKMRYFRIHRLPTMWTAVAGQKSKLVSSQRGSGKPQLGHKSRKREETGAALARLTDLGTEQSGPPEKAQVW